MPSRKLLLVAALFVATSAAARPKKPPAAPPVAKICEECHGANGIATAPGVPHLNGQIAENFSEALEQFKLGKRPSTAPAHASAELTSQDIEALARYYQAQKGQRPPQPADAAKVAEAAPVYRRRCAKCHMDNGRESDHDAPLMAGQSLEYLQAQTMAFVTGKRKFPFLMDEAYQGLSPEDLERLSHYFAGQSQ